MVGVPKLLGFRIWFPRNGFGMLAAIINEEFISSFLRCSFCPFYWVSFLNFYLLFPLISLRMNPRMNLTGVECKNWHMWSPATRRWALGNWVCGIATAYTSLPLYRKNRAQDGLQSIDKYQTWKQQIILQQINTLFWDLWICLCKCMMGWVVCVNVIRCTL